MTNYDKFQAEPEIYQGQFGEFTITPSDRLGVKIYRSGLMVAAVCFAICTTLVVWPNTTEGFTNLLTPLYACFCLGLGVSLVMIHIYLAILHRLLQLFWLIGAGAAVWISLTSSDPLAIAVYNDPIALFGIGFTFAGLTGIYFKEAFCFNRLETKILTPLVPVLILGHLFDLLSPYAEKLMLVIWAMLFLVFAFRKVFQAIPDDIGDKSVFAYLKQKRSAQA
jgi:uncharacterized integral membrane protein